MQKKIKGWNGFSEAFKLLKEKHLFLFAIILFDILFVAAYILFNWIWSSVFPASEILSELIKVNWILWLSSLIVLLYFGLIIVIYSFFKYIVLYFVMRCFKKARYSFKNFGNFLLFNIIAAACFFAYYLAVSFFAFRFVQQELIGWFGMVALFPVLYFIYPYINARQIMIITSNIKKGFLKKKIVQYSLMYLVDIAAIAVYSILFLILTFVLNLILFKDQFTSLFQAYQQIFIFVTMIFLLLILVFNRIYMYSLVQKM